MKCIWAAALLFSVLVARADDSTLDFKSQIQLKVEKYKLQNGLTILLHEDHSAPLVSFHTWFKVGSKNEEPGFTGMAHLFEHLMFKGAKRYSGEQLESVLQSNGGVNNAFTTHDYTAYFIELPSSKLELALDMESDRMQFLQVNAANLKSEREVVKEERRFRVDDSPMGSLMEAIYATAYRVHPYRWPVIGFMEDLDNISLEKCMDFYRAHYAPNNAVLVLAGDFKSDQVKPLIEKYYGAIPSQTIVERARPSEPVQVSARSQVISKQVESHTMAMVYHTPKAGSPQVYALDLLANILGRGTSSRLYRRLVYKDQLASLVSVSNSTNQEGGLFEVVVKLKAKADFERTKRATLGEIWKPRNWLVTQQELNAAKKQIMKTSVDSLKTLNGRAESLALNEVLFGDYNQLFEDLDRYNRVTAEEVRSVASRYLAVEHGSFVTMKPAPQAIVPSKKHN